jgi:3-oxoacid CoA-transferase subunit A
VTIKNWFVTGDTHGQNKTRVKNILHNNPELKPEETAIIILGDVGFNYSLNKSDYWNKYHASKFGCHIYCVRGNHEERPELVPGMCRVYDEEVQGLVYVESDFLLIKYFIDGEFYQIGKYKTLVIGGAYSIDKHYRLRTDMNWFPNEQLTKSEMAAIEHKLIGEKVDLVLTHTCPISWQSTDLFINNINQFQIDNTMEIWLDEIEKCIEWKVWCFGHYHADRIQKPHVEIFYTGYQKLDEIMERWEEYDKISDLDWWLEITKE